MEGNNYIVFTKTHSTHSHTKTLCNKTGFPDTFPHVSPLYKSRSDTALAVAAQRSVSLERRRTAALHKPPRPKTRRGHTRAPQTILQVTLDLGCSDATGQRPVTDFYSSSSIFGMFVSMSLTISGAFTPSTQPISSPPFMNTNRGMDVALNRSSNAGHTLRSMM